jgi:hypothetical protein
VAATAGVYRRITLPYIFGNAALLELSAIILPKADTKLPNLRRFVRC